MISLATCGIGNIGRVHLKNLLSLRGCKVGGIFDRNAGELSKIAHDFSVRAYRSWNELLEDPQLHGIVIATPASSHRELCCSALAAGKHVFVEKPLANSLEDSLAIVKAEAAAATIVQVGFCERFNVAYIEAKRAATEGRLGRIRFIQSSRIAPYHLSDPTWELGVFDTAAHNFDLILWLMGKSPCKVFARGANVYEEDAAIPHTCTTVLTFEDGSVAADHIAWVREEKHPLAHCAKSQMFIQGSRGAFRVDHCWRPAWLLNDEGFRGVDTVIIGGPEYYSCLKLQFDHFLRAIEGEVPSSVSAREALKAEVVCLSALDSLRRGQELSVPEEGAN
jgi:myo-inositol 2-dehydrogenase/D-chiro-inositol 1-dehydrogenase